MGDDMKQCLDRDRFERDHHDRDRCDRRIECESSSDRDDDYGQDWDLGSWLPIIIIVFLLCGGTNIFGGTGSSSSDNGFGSSWILIIILLFLFLGNKNGSDGIFGGLFR